MQICKTISWRNLCCTAAIFAIGGLASMVRHASAWPTTSPSARQAARLKYNPPANWIRHYLGDDRYKIAGGTWKVVSTQNDSRYHRADCPSMLRQSADIVIGFPSPAHAREAGYEADPLCAPDISSISPYGLTLSDVQTNLNGRGGRLTGKRIVLADGVSSVILPRGWSRTKVPAIRFGGMTASSDVLTGPGAGTMRISIIRFARTAGFNFSKLLTVQGMRQSRAQMQEFMAKGTQDPKMNQMFAQLSENLKNQQIDAYNLGGIEGVRMRMAPGSRNAFGLGEASRQYIAAGRGSKVYSIEDSTTREELGNAVIASFRPR
jgi:hypothetical protein